MWLMITILFLCLSFADTQFGAAEGSQRKLADVQPATPNSISKVGHTQKQLLCEQLLEDVEDHKTWKGCSVDNPHFLGGDKDFLLSFNKSSAASKRVAVVLRGQAFREHLQSHSFDCSEKSLKAQFEAAKGFLNLFGTFEDEGYEVDLFIATYQCPNTVPGRPSFVDKLVAFFNEHGYVRRVLILESTNKQKSLHRAEFALKYSQNINFISAVRLAAEHMADFQIRYDFFYILRLDHQADLLPPCPFPRFPREVVAEDFGQIIPAGYIPCFVSMVIENQWKFMPVPVSIYRLRYEVDKQTSDNFPFLREHVSDSGSSASAASLQKSFRMFDLDEDGFISREEISVVMQKMGRPLSDQALSDYVSDVDMDGDGKINYEEEGRKHHIVSCQAFLEGEETSCLSTCPSIPFGKCEKQVSWATVYHPIVPIPVSKT